MKSVSWKIIVIVLMPLFAIGQVTGLRRELNDLIRYETNIDYAETPGFIVGMIDEDTSFIFSFGKKSLEDETLIRKDDVFEYGGATKVFTTLLLQLVRDEYKIDLHQSINAYLPVQNPSFDSCTIFKLLTHTAGLPKYPPGWGLKEKDAQDPFGFFNRLDLEDFFKTYTQLPYCNEYLYSHLNYALIEWLLEYRTGQQYNELITKYIHPYFNVSTEWIPTIPGYNLHKQPVKSWSYKTFAGALGMRGSLVELMNLCHHFLYNKRPAFRQMMDAIPTSIRKNEGWVSMGWQVIPIPKNRFIYSQNGRTEGHHTFIGIIPETRTAVVILANSAAGSDLLGLAILRMMNRNWKRK